MKCFGLTFHCHLFVLLFVLSIGLAISSPAWAQKSLPQQLTATERAEVIKTLGLNTSGKILSNPYPLGGHSGLEVGLSAVIVDTSEFESLGCQAGEVGCPTQTGEILRELSFTRFHLAKGLYHNLDLFFHFSPPLGRKPVQDFGGLLRWGFFQSPFTPTQLSLILHGNQFNYADSFRAQTLGGLFKAGVNVPQASIYIALGYATSKGQLAPNYESKSVGDFHSLIGVTLEHQPWFLALQIDRYKDIVYSAKLGLRL